MNLLRIPLAWYYWLTNRNDEIAQRRLSICVQCDQLKRITEKKGFVCGVCLCPIQAKARLLDEVCPHPKGDKWDSYFKKVKNMGRKSLTLNGFMEKVYHEPNTGCWLWAGILNKKGYGCITKKLSDGTKIHGAHRVSRYLHSGPFDYNLCVCHKCDVRCCVNPDHLFLDTVFGNNEDMVKKGRACKGEDSHKARLTEIQVREIRAKYATGQYTYRELAIEYDMHDVNHVINGKGWRHIL